MIVTPFTHLYIYLYMYNVYTLHMYKKMHIQLSVHFQKLKNVYIIINAFSKNYQLSISEIYQFILTFVLSIINLKIKQ
jgi:hypothetical protein